MRRGRNTAQRSIELRAKIRIGYKLGLRCCTIAQLTGSSVGSIKVIAHKMGLKHPVQYYQGPRYKESPDLLAEAKRRFAVVEDALDAAE